MKKDLKIKLLICLNIIGCSLYGAEKEDGWHFVGNFSDEEVEIVGLDCAPRSVECSSTHYQAEMLCSKGNEEKCIGVDDVAGRIAIIVVTVLDSGSQSVYMNVTPDSDAKEHPQYAVLKAWWKKLGEKNRVTHSKMFCVLPVINNSGFLETGKVKLAKKFGGACGGLSPNNYFYCSSVSPSAMGSITVKGTGSGVGIQYQEGGKDSKVLWQTSIEFRK